MVERTSRPRVTPTVALLASAVVGTGVGLFGLAPAAADGVVPAAHRTDDDPRPDHHRFFHDRDDVKYVWFRLCDTTATTTTIAAPTTTTTTTAPVAEATDAVQAAVDGAQELTTPTDTTTTTEPTTGTTTEDADDDGPDLSEYPTFVAVPMARDEARELTREERRSCYDPTTRALATTTTTEPTTTTVAPVPETTVPAPTTTTAGGPAG
jgi:hypothetical protein